MKISKAKQDQISAAIGLQFGKNNISYDEGVFKKYISREYTNSVRKRSDEIYRMFEMSLIHQVSGLRITYTTTESYFGDSVEYKLISMFIITRAQKTMEIVDVDFNEKLFFTTNEVIPFAEVDMLIK